VVRTTSGAEFFSVEFTQVGSVKNGNSLSPIDGSSVAENSAKGEIRASESDTWLAKMQNWYRMNFTSTSDILMIHKEDLPIRYNSVQSVCILY
jgi:hypothetical protein